MLVVVGGACECMCVGGLRGKGMGLQDKVEREKGR